MTSTSEMEKQVRKIALDFLSTHISQEDITAEALRELATKYGDSRNLEETREIISKASKKSDMSLSETLKTIREEA